MQNVLIQKKAWYLMQNALLWVNDLGTSKRTYKICKLSIVHIMEAHI